MSLLASAGRRVPNCALFTLAVLTFCASRGAPAEPPEPAGPSRQGLSGFGGTPLSPTGAPRAAQITLETGAVALPHLSPFEAISITCDAAVVFEFPAARCQAATLSLRHPHLGTGSAKAAFTIDGADGSGEMAIARLGIAGGALSGSAAVDARGWSVQGTLAGAALEAVLASIDPARGLAEVSGRLDGTVDAAGSGTGVRRAAATVTLSNVAFSGRSEARDVSGQGRVSIARTDAGALEAEAGIRVDAGIAYLEPGFTVGAIAPGFPVEITGAPLTMNFDGRWTPADRRLDGHVVFEHPGVASADAQFEVSLGGERRLHAMELRCATNDIAGLYATYLQPVLLGGNLDALELSGAAQAAVLWASDGLEGLSLRFDDVHAYDGRGRFDIAGLTGSLKIGGGSRPLASHVEWAGGGLYRIEFGAGRLRFSSSGSTLELVESSDIGMLGGSLRMDSLRVTEAGRPDMKIELGGVLKSVSMQALTHALAWPLFEGELSGLISGLSYARSNLVLDGELSVRAFGGAFVIRNLRIDELFGAIPRLHADIEVDDVDLEQLTRIFSFGKIEGRISGRMRGLRMEAWRPVYFEAEFATPPDDDSRHRISQRAVDNLGALGGGLPNVVSTGLLRLFRAYSYDRLGVSCRLLNGYCQMGGIVDTEDGFYMLTRGGLMPPWIEVKGTGRSIEWTSLIEGLKTIAREEAIIR